MLCGERVKSFRMKWHFTISRDYFRNFHSVEMHLFDFFGMRKTSAWMTFWFNIAKFIIFHDTERKISKIFICIVRKIKSALLQMFSLYITIKWNGLVYILNVLFSSFMLLCVYTQWQQIHCCTVNVLSSCGESTNIHSFLFHICSIQCLYFICEYSTKISLIL